MEEKKFHKRTLRGCVVSDKMDKSVIVEVETFKKHPQYGKYIKRSKKYISHDEKNECAMGDRVVIVECRPLSKSKRWRVGRVLQRSA